MKALSTRAKTCPRCNSYGNLFACNERDCPMKEQTLRELRLLMPEKFVREDIRAMGGIDLTEDKPIRDLAKKYGVSVAMMTMRLGQLGLGKYDF